MRAGLLTSLSIAAMVAGVLCLGGCNGGSDGAAPVVTVTDTVTGGPTDVTSSPTTSSSSPTSTDSTTASTGAENLTVSPGIREALINAGAAAHGLPATDFTGLAQGSVYYGIDHSTGIYWAGASMVPNSTSQEAQVSVQDDGAYTIFELAPGQAWHGVDVGLGGTGSQCALQPPADVLAAWGWSAGGCHPQNF